MGVVAFWIALAAVLIAGGWAKSRSEAQKHETLRKIIERNGTVDEAQLRQLFGRGPRRASTRSRAVEDARLPRAMNRRLRGFGTFSMCVAAGLRSCSSLHWGVHGTEENAMAYGVASES